MCEEVWKPVVGYEGLYEVSDWGRVRSIRTCTCTYYGRILRGGTTPNWYRTVSLHKDGRAISKVVHKLVTTAFLGECPDGKVVNHKNGNKQDNRLANLEYVTPSENNIHAYQVLGVSHARGEQCHAAILNEASVLAIYEQLTKGVAPSEIARNFGISPASVFDIKHRKTWKHIPIPDEWMVEAKQQEPKLRFGTCNHNAKLNPVKVREIRSMIACGISRTVIAREYGVTRRVIQQIELGLTWKHVA